MVCLFVHDFRAYKRENGIFSITFTYDTWKTRYLNVFDRIRIINRLDQFKKCDVSKLKRADGEDVEFIEDFPYKKILDLFLKRRKILEYMKKEVGDADFVIIRLHSFSGLLAAKQCQNLGKRYLIELVGCPWDAFWNHGILGKLLAPYMYLKTKKVVYEAKYVIYVTKEFLQKRYPTKGKSLQCSNVEIHAQEQPGIEWRIRQIEKKKDKIIIATTAAINVRSKGQDTVIRALARLNNRSNRYYEYWLIGEGNPAFMTKVAKKYKMSSHVKFLGTLPRQQVLQKLDEVDIYVQPSKQEGLPRALIEAMSRGCYAFGTIVAGIPELLEKEDLFKPEDDKTLAQKINALTDKDFRDKAIRNIETSKTYSFEILNAERKKFLERFVKNE